MARRILCAVDGSKAAERAAACAVGLAKASGAKLRFLTVNIVPARSLKSYFWDTTLLSAADAQAHKQLAAAIKVAKAARFEKCDAVIATGNSVADVIVAYATKHKADHLVVGTTTTNELARIFLGSVAAAVVSHARCPVTVVK